MKWLLSPCMSPTSHPTATIVVKKSSLFFKGHIETRQEGRTNFHPKLTDIYFRHVETSCGFWGCEMDFLPFLLGRIHLSHLCFKIWKDLKSSGAVLIYSLPVFSHPLANPFHPHLHPLSKHCQLHHHAQGMEAVNSKMGNCALHALAKGIQWQYSLSLLEHLVEEEVEVETWRFFAQILWDLWGVVGVKRLHGWWGDVGEWYTLTI